MEDFRSKSKTILYVIIIGVILILVFVFHSFSYFSRTSEQSELEQRQVQLKELSEQEAFTVDMLMESFMSSANALADALSINMEEYSDRELFDFLDRMAKKMTADNIFIADTDGYLAGAERENSKSLVSEAFFKRAMIGQTSISNVKYNAYIGGYFFTIAAPIYTGDEIVAVLLAEYDTSSVSRFLDATTFEGEGYSHIFQISDGKFISYSTHAENDGTEASSFYRIADAKFEDGYSFLELYGNIFQHKSGLVAYQGATGKKYYGYYTPTSLTKNWYIFTVVPAILVDKYADSSASAALALTIRICLAFLVLILASIFLYFGYQKDLLQANEKMHISEEGFRIAVDHMPCFVFMSDLISGKLELIKGSAQHALPPFASDASLSSVLEHLVAPEYSDCIQRSMEKINAGVKCTDCLFRIKYANSDDYEWAKLTISNIFDKDDKPVKLIGTLEDVNEQMEKEKDLKMQAQTDPLTGIANRIAIREWIEAFNETATKSNDLSGAYVLLDVDNFKHFNDAYGHTFGDVVLKIISTQLSKTYSAFPQSLVARIGGDEFGVLISSEKDREKIITLSEDFCKTISKYKESLPENCQLTISLGIAFWESTDKDFALLFDRADKALYQAKNTGKDQCCVYSEDLPARPD